MEKVKFNFEGGLQNAAKIGLVGWFGLQTLSPLKVEAQIAILNESRGTATVGIIETPFGDCIQGADHAQSLLSEGRTDKIGFLAEGQDEIIPLKFLFDNPKKAQNTFIKGSDIAFRCPNTKANLFLRKDIIKILPSEKNFRTNLQKKPKSSLFRTESLMTPYLEGTNKNGKTIRIEPSNPKPPTNLRNLKYSTLGTLGTVTQKIEICLLNVKIQDTYKIKELQPDKNDISYPNNFFGLAKHNNPYSGKIKKNFSVEPIASGTSGSTLFPISKENTAGVVSTSFPSREVQKLLLKKISKFPELRKSLQNCAKFGFYPNNSQLTTIGMSFSDSIITNKTNYIPNNINTQNNKVQSNYPTLFPVMPFKAKP